MFFYAERLLDALCQKRAKHVPLDAFRFSFCSWGSERCRYSILHACRKVEAPNLPPFSANLACAECTASVPYVHPEMTYWPHIGAIYCVFSKNDAFRKGRRNRRFLAGIYWNSLRFPVFMRLCSRQRNNSSPQCAQKSLLHIELA